MTKLLPFDPADLAERLHIDVRLLYLLSNRTPDFYRIYRIPKKNGTFRTIEAPFPLLKRLQRRILTEFLNADAPSPQATAFRRGTGIVDNAAMHCGSETVLKLDLKNFFPSLRYAPVREYFSSRGFTPEVAVLLAKLCTLYGHLPQGAPTSPALSNLLLSPFDGRLIERFPGLRISRYADDITVSGDLTEQRIQEIIRFCRAELAPLHLKLNDRKIAVLRRGCRQTVTGLSVNDKVAAPRELRRRVRQTMYYLNKYRNEADDSALNRLRGTVNFICHADPANAEFADYRRQLFALPISAGSEAVKIGGQQEHPPFPQRSAGTDDPPERPAQ